MNGDYEKVSVHGGHSGQFCEHARDRLEEIVAAYIEAGFSWVGITEHMPAAHEAVLYPEERAAGLTPARLQRRFGDYIRECRRLQSLHAGQLTIYVGMESESYSGSAEHLERLLAEWRPDYLVGSVHHVDDIPFDYSPEEYARAVRRAGSLQALYQRYFDQQYELLLRFRPAVVGHFDLIRMFDADYRRHLEEPEIAARVRRNLDFIAEHGLLLDLNLRSYRKGADEPYVSGDILALAKDRAIGVVPGDDSHGRDEVGDNLERGVARLRRAGLGTGWPRPKLYR